MPIKTILLFLIVGINFCSAQDTTLVLSPSMFDKTYQEIWLAPKEGWLYKSGNDTIWARKEIDLTGWRAFKPTELSVKDADQNGRLEGWFRIKIKLDNGFTSMPLFMEMGSWMATDLYIDGKYIASTGSTGINGKPYEEHKWIAEIDPTFPVPLLGGQEYILALHVVDFVSDFNYRQLKSQSIQAATANLNVLININGPNSQPVSISFRLKWIAFQYVCLAVCAILCILFWLLLFQNKKESILLSIALYATFFTLANYCRIHVDTTYGLSFISVSLYSYAAGLFGGLFGVMGIIFISNLLKKVLTAPLKIIFFSIFFCTLLTTTFPNQPLILVSVVLMIIPIIYLISTSYSKLKGAQWAVVVGLGLTLTWAILFTYNGVKYQHDTFPFPFFYIYLGGLYLSFPLSLLVYVSIRFKEILTDIQNKAQQVVLLSVEKRENAIKQQRILEEEVAKQTIEIRTAFEYLKSTQSQLIQSEKMASLGELTAGIAHEIQNPLNFVNNFSEVNTELIAEMKAEIEKGNYDEVKALAKDVEENEQKINHHGKRAGDIVKGMLQHSRTSSGVKEPTNINTLADEYLRLAYHGLRAKDKSFNANMKTDFDESIGNITVVPQDIGRVILNLITNAFYAVTEKQKHASTSSAGQPFEPTVSVSTHHSLSSREGRGEVIIKVKDNGNGIPQKILDKIFQPFFTTKPTGQGTGLGLSLSYDIVKAHGGELRVETREGVGSEFVISIPA